MTKLLAVIATEDRGTQAVLAAEALRKAAAGLGATLAVETRTGASVQGQLAAADIAGADKVLLVGAAADTRFAGKTTVTSTLDAVLADANAVVAKALSGAAAPAAAGPLKIVAITSCPTGIAHTFMAAEGVEQGAKALGHAAKVETQGSVGAQNTLSAEEIAAADLVIIAADTNVDLARFKGKKLYSTGTKGAINDGKGLVAKAIAEATV